MLETFRQGNCFMVLLIYCLVCGVICAVIAGSKNRSGIGWFFLGCLLNIIAIIIIAVIGDPARVQTIVIQNSVSAGAAPLPPASTGEGRRWTQADLDAAEGRRYASRPLPIAAAKSVAAAKIDRRQLQPAVVALKVLAEAGRGGFDDHAVDGVMTYLEVENGDAEYSRREAAELANWMRGLPSDDVTIRDALQDLIGAVSQRSAFLSAAQHITGESPTDRQIRWSAFLEKRLGA